MQKSIWSGTIGFGLVHVPVKLYTAQRSHDIKFNQITPAGNRTSMPTIDSVTGETIKHEDLKVGYEITKDKYVIFSKDEIEALKPVSAKHCEINEFVPLDSIDPLQFEKTYWIGPAVIGSRSAYDLLVHALTTKQVVGITKVTIRSREALSCIRALHGRLVLSMLSYADEIIPLDIPEGAQVAEAQAKLAETLVESMTVESFDLSAYKDTYRDQVLAMISAKASDEAFTPVVESMRGSIDDMMAALEASLKDAAEKKQPVKV